MNDLFEPPAIWSKRNDTKVPRAARSKPCSDAFAILGITGDVKASEIVPKLEKALAVWKKTEVKEVLPANPKPIRPTRMHFINSAALLFTLYT